MGISWGFLSLLIPFVILGFVQLANDKIAYVNQMDFRLKALIFSTFSSICSVIDLMTLRNKFLCLYNELHSTRRVLQLSKKYIYFGLADTNLRMSAVQ